MFNYAISAIMTLIVVVAWLTLEKLTGISWITLGLVSVTFSLILRIPYKKDDK